jgi:triacylglycerol lipase
MAGAERIEEATRAQLDQWTPLDFTSVHTMRAGYEPTPTPPAPPTPGVEREDAVIDGVTVRWYRPARSVELPRKREVPPVETTTLLWLHGGGYIMGNLNENDDRLDRLVLATGLNVVSVDYRLGPEHPYPAGLDDATAVYRGLLAAGLPPSRIVVGGASAGSGVAAALCLRLRELELPQPALQLLVYPMLDERETESMKAFTEPVHPMFWPAHAYRLCWQAYLGEVYGQDVPATAAPARATDLSGLAPAFMSIGDLDAFLDENLEYARRLSRDGVPTELHVYPGVIHGGFGFVPRTPQTQALLDDVYRALNAVVGAHR